MTSIGIVRNVDELGRVVIPKETRQLLFIKEGDSLEIFEDGDEIVLKKYSPGCTFCGDMDKIALFKGLNVCQKCRNDLSSLNS